VSTENKLALALLTVGAAALAVYWYTPQEAMPSKKVASPQEERIILPSGKRADVNIPEVRHYLEKLRTSMMKGEPFLPLEANELDETRAAVQTLLLRDKAFNADARKNGKPLRNEMMRIYPSPVSHLDKRLQQACKQKDGCFSAEKYNFATNTTTRAVVAPATHEVLRVERFAGMQPDINLRLRRVAEAIALNDPAVKKALGHLPAKNELSMSNVRGNMEGSICERTDHLCVAPTFPYVKEARALWAAVDLTELRLAAAKWAPLGKSATPACISERVLQNRYIMENFCQKDNLIERNGWHIIYRLTTSDGLEIRDVSFGGTTVLDSAKIVDWHVSYAAEGKADTNDSVYVEGRRVEFVQENNDTYHFGYNDAMGCPMFSTSVVLPFNGPQIKPLPQGGGFMLTQDFRNPKWPLACNYRYENRYEFYDDGRFRIVSVNKGRGCAADATYRPVMRIDVAGERGRFYARKQDGMWELWKKERYEKVREGKRPYRYVWEAGALLLEPDRGQWGESRGDNATIFVTRFHPQEGDTDLLTLGSCCKLDEDGPERYINGEDIVDANIVLWYVPRIRNDNRPGQEYCWADSIIDENGNMGVKVWPCSVGPMFVPENLEKGK
jgi:hypothetical protein